MDHAEYFTYIMHLKAGSEVNATIMLTITLMSTGRGNPEFTSKYYPTLQGLSLMSEWGRVPL
jgi:hypothetical protein